MRYNRNYSVHSVCDDEGNFFHCVYEEKTEQPINFFFFKEDADDLSSFLEAGGGFDGWTPPFFLTQINIPQNKEVLNVEFDEEFENMPAVGREII